MIDELITILITVKQVDHNFDKLWRSAWEDIGVTQEFLDEASKV